MNKVICQSCQWKKKGKEDYCVFYGYVMFGMKERCRAYQEREPEEEENGDG